jgi:hypothetical protein
MLLLPAALSTLSSTPPVVAAAPHPFTDIAAPIPGLFRSSVAWGDVDRDGDLDLLLTGWNPGGLLSRIYRNDAGAFVDLGAGLAAVETGAGDWVDFDRDGDLDVFVFGTFGVPPSRLYRNDGGAFVDVGAGFPGYYQASSAWGDLDNDGDPDLILAGTRSGSASAANLFRNDGGGVFVECPFSVPGFHRGSLDLGDFDGDHDLDLLITGWTAGGPRTEVYRNDGNLDFAAAGAGLMPLFDGRGAWGDVDADGDLDVLVCGSDQTSSHVFTKLYRNDGSGFVDAGLSLIGAGEGGDLAWGDFDGDGDLDYAALGLEFGGASLFRNQDGAFVEDADLPHSCCGALGWGDYDGDLDIDMAFTGLNNIGKILRNDAPPANTAPSSPGGLAAVVSGHDVELNWLAGADAETPTPGLSYNLRVGTAPGAGDVLSPLALSSGRRLVSEFGNAGPSRGWSLRGLPDGTYFWSVQSIDASFVGSAFAVEGSFTIGATVGVDESAPLAAGLRITRALPSPIAAPGTLTFELSRPQSVVVEVFDSTGRRIAELARGAHAAGRHQASWDPRGAAPGIYWYRVSGAGSSATGRTVVIGGDAGR